MTKITTSNISGSALTTSGILANTANNNFLWTTSTSTHYNPNIGNQFVYNNEPTPFHINFSWDGKTVDVTLKNGNDIFKLANAFMEWLDKNEIDYSVKTKGKRKKK
jgi:hypothetical protein